MIINFLLIFRSVSKDSPKESETRPEQDQKGNMPSPQVSPNFGVDADIMVNGGEPSVFAEPHAGARQNIPEHIKPDELPKDELRTLVRQQLEYYFSRYETIGTVCTVYLHFENNANILTSNSTSFVTFL